MRLEIRNQGLELPAEARRAFERRLRFLLGRFGTRIGRVTVYLVDLGGTLGELKIGCRIVVRLAPFGQVRIEVAAVDLDTAVDWAARRLGPALQREFMRWRDRRGVPAR
jgi:hypothetical protein